VLTVRDLQVPEGIRVLTSLDQAVAIVSPPMAEETPAAAPAAAVAVEPEVLTERKKEEAPADDAKKARK
jgi:hypothetical protein